MSCGFEVEKRILNNGLIFAILSNSSANVNIFITTVTTTQATFESSAPFNGKVNFQIVSQD